MLDEQPPPSGGGRGADSGRGVGRQHELLADSGGRAGCLQGTRSERRGESTHLGNNRAEVLCPSPGTNRARRIGRRIGFRRKLGRRVIHDAAVGCTHDCELIIEAVSRLSKMLLREGRQHLAADVTRGPSRQ